MAEPLRKIPERDLLAELERIADAAEPEVRAAFLAAVRSLVDASQLDLLELALASGDAALAEAALPWNLFEEALLRSYSGERALAEVTRKGADLGLRLLPGGAGGGVPPSLRTDRIYANARAYLKEHGAVQVKQISRETRAGFRTLLDEAFSKGKSVKGTARDIREILNSKQVNGLIGIRQDQAASLAKKLNAWIDNPDLSAAKIQQLANREHARMLRDRADLISRTEIYDAANQGQVEAWKEVNASGELSIEGLDGEFLDVAAETALRPPLHPRCYCSSRLVRLRGREGRVYVREWVARLKNSCPRCERMDGVRALAA